MATRARAKATGLGVGTLAAAHREKVLVVALAEEALLAGQIHRAVEVHPGSHQEAADGRLEVAAEVVASPAVAVAVADPLVVAEAATPGDPGTYSDRTPLLGQR